MAQLPTLKTLAENAVREALNDMVVIKIGEQEYAWDEFVTLLESGAIRPYVYAHWEEDPESERKWHCSNCKTVQGVTCIVMNYCPNCGAQMAEHPWLADGTGQAFSPD